MVAPSDNDRIDIDSEGSDRGVNPWSEDHTTMLYASLMPDSEGEPQSIESSESADAARSQPRREPAGKTTLLGLQPIVPVVETANLPPSRALPATREVEECPKRTYRSYGVTAAALGLVGAAWLGHSWFDAQPSAAMPPSSVRAVAMGPAAPAGPSRALADVLPPTAERGSDTQLVQAPTGAASELAVPPQSDKRAAAKEKRAERMRARKEAAEARRAAAKEKHAAAKEKHTAAADARREKAAARKEAAEERRAAAKEKHAAAIAAREEKAAARKEAAAQRRAEAKEERESAEDSAAAKREAARERREAAKEAAASRREEAKAKREEAAEARREAAEAKRAEAEARREEARSRREGGDSGGAVAHGAPGTLRINARPWAQVFVDGSLVGYTPQLGIRVAPGRHSVRLVNGTFGMSKTFDVEVGAGQQVTRVEMLEE